SILPDPFVDTPLKRSGSFGDLFRGLGLGRRWEGDALRGGHRSLRRASGGIAAPSARPSAVHGWTNAWPTALGPVADYYFYIQPGTTAAVHTLGATFAMLNSMESFDRIRSRRRKTRSVFWKSHRGSRA